MKAFRRRAVAHVANQISEAEKQKKLEAAAEAEAKKKAQALAPKGNRRTRRAQTRFNTLLNRKLRKASSLGHGVSMTVGPDGGVHVKVSKHALQNPVEKTEESPAPSTPRAPEPDYK